MQQVFLCFCGVVFQVNSSNQVFRLIFVVVLVHINLRLKVQVRSLQDLPTVLAKYIYGIVIFLLCS